MNVAFITTPNDVLLAIGYRNRPVLIWNALELRLKGQCIVDANNGIDALAFNPNPEITALVVSYNDGRLCLFNYTTMILAFTLPDQHAHSVACSTDGRSLVTGSSTGVIEVFDFDYRRGGSHFLTSIYRINVGYSIRGIVFSSDGLRFVDIHDQQCHIWSPASLVRVESEVGSISDAATLIRKDSELGEMDDNSNYSMMTARTLDNPEEPDITSSLVTSADGQFVIAGKRGGIVALFSAASGKEIGTLYQHARGVLIKLITLGESRSLIVSADDSGRVLAGQLTISPAHFAAESQGPRQNLPAARIVLDRRFGDVVEHLLINNAADRLYVSGYNIQELWELPSGKVLARTDLSLVNGVASPPPSATNGVSKTTGFLSGSNPTNTAYISHSAFHHPTNSEWFIVVVRNFGHVFTWANFEELTSSEGIRLERPPTPVGPPQSSHASLASEMPRFGCHSPSSTYHTGPGLVVELVRSFPSAPPRLRVWPAEAFNPYAPRTSALPAPEPGLETAGPGVLAVLGFTGMSLVYLDMNLWVCSAVLQSAVTDKGSAVGGTSPPAYEAIIQRHFFALSEWRTADGELKCTLATGRATSRHIRSRDVLFVSGHRLVVVKGGLTL